MNRRLTVVLAAVLAIGACSEQQEPITGNSNPGELASSNATKPINVVTKTPATPAQLAQLAQYGNVFKEIREIKAVIMAGKESSLASIRALPFVAAANFDQERNVPPDVSLPVNDLTTLGASTWDLDAVNVTEGQTGSDRLTVYNGTPILDGTGVYVAILDTGLLPTWRYYFPQERIATEFAKSFGGGGNERGNVSEQPNKWEQDTHSHGTHVTSTVIGYNFPSPSGPKNGVAPKAKIIPVKVLGQTGSGWSSVIAAGITYIGTLKGVGGALHNSPVVINMSLGGPDLDAVEKAAIDFAVGNGVIIVASAGNSGPDGPMGFPGAYQPVIGVAASGWVGEWRNCLAATPLIFGNWWRSCNVLDPTSAVDFYITDFSSRQGTGQDLDVAAPGSWVVGPFQEQQGQLSWFFLGGTSMASPHVAGIAALMAQKHPSLTGPQTEAILTDPANVVALPPGCRDILNPDTAAEDHICWGADATGAGLTTANLALAGTP